MKNLTMFTDDQLISLYRNGNSPAFDTLVGRHKDRIYTSILILVKDEQVANDLFQEVFIRIIKSLHKGSYTEDGRFLSWAICVAHNMCIDYFRAQKRNRVIPSELDFERFDAPEETIEEDSSYTEKNSFSREYAMQLINSLPPEQREVVILRHYADLSFKEIASLTHCSINTALGRMRYALNNLRRQLGERSVA